MSRFLGLGIALLVLFLPGPARGADEPAEGGIAWAKDLKTAFAKAKESDRILMICVNAKHVDGRKDEEPAAKGLREVVYTDARVVKRSRDFVCAMVSPKSSVADHGELGNLGITDPIISPQHIFVSSDGQRILVREEYWPHGKGEKAVARLLEMMKLAEEEAGLPPKPDDPAPAGAKKEEGPADDAARAGWIQEMLGKIDDFPDVRQAALAALVREDRDGDCTGPILEKLDDYKKEPEILRDLIRVLGRPGLEAAAEPIADFLGHREETIRANAAVSLEYIGSRDRKIISDLSRALGREPVEEIANHIARALGRCGAEESKARGLLLKMAASGKSDFSTYGPAIGLAYFEGDATAARGVEKILKQIGVPSGGRGGFQHTVKRALLSWTLAAIGDEKSEEFVNKELLAGLEKVDAFWVDGMIRFWEAVAAKCGGDQEAMAQIEEGVRFSVGAARRWASRDAKFGMMDEAREGREAAGFTPKGDGLLQGRRE